LMVDEPDISRDSLFSLSVARTARRKCELAMPYLASPFDGINKPIFSLAHSVHKK
jgi:hypothetical protein